MLTMLAVEHLSSREKTLESSIYATFIEKGNL